MCHTLEWLINILNLKNQFDGVEGVEGFDGPTSIMKFFTEFSTQAGGDGT